VSNQERAPAPQASGLGAVLSIVQAVVALVPRWLVVGAGVIFLAWLGFDLYINTQLKLLDLQAKQAETRAKTITPKGMGAGASVRDILPADVPTPESDAARKQELLAKARGETPKAGRHGNWKDTPEETAALKEECVKRHALGQGDLSNCAQFGIVADDDYLLKTWKAR
jgi:hypothetical protein